MKEEKIIEGSATESEGTKKEEKKENAFTTFWKKTKQNIDNSILESKIENTFNEQNTEYTIYQKQELLSTTVYGYLDNDRIIVFGERSPKEYSVIIDQKTDKVYYISNISKGTVNVEVDGVNYERPATIFATDDEVVEVNVIKAGKKYYLYKGK